MCIGHELIYEEALWGTRKASTFSAAAQCPDPKSPANRWLVSHSEPPRKLDARESKANYLSCSHTNLPCIALRR
jgi:hypothetical protein